MVLRQCIACSILITDSTRTCVCGHVLDNASHDICGKRFSEYRAELYSRLATRKRKVESRKNTNQPLSCLKELKDLDMTGSSMPAKRPRDTPVKKRRSVDSKPLNKKKTNRRANRKPTGLSSALKRQQENRRVVPVELLLRFPSALQEINRRIMGQNNIWLALQTDKKTLCFQE